MDLLNYKNLSTSEKILLVEEIWDSISEDKIALTKEQKDILDTRLKAYKNSSRRTSWEAIKKKARARKPK
jgi:putative addiction module component (TIGR02574 family)